jgi:hypothetical protein
MVFFSFCSVFHTWICFTHGPLWTLLIEHISRLRFVLECLLLCVSVCACLYLAMCSFGHAVMSVYLVVFWFEFFLDMSSSV